MSAIRSKNTKPEISIRKRLFLRGYRYRLHNKKMAGSPDIVLSKYRAAIFVNGCFWHGHDCFLFQMPKTNTAYWHKKITANKKRDLESIETLLNNKWRVLVIWECTIYRKNEKCINSIIDKIERWLHSNRKKVQMYSS